jgi:hypothetical protein
MKNFGLKPGDDVREIGRVHQPIDQGPRLRHGTDDSSGPPGEETVLNVRAA